MFTKYVEGFLTKDECEEIIQLGKSSELLRMKSSRFVNGKLVEQNVEYDNNKRTGCYFIGDTLDAPILKNLSKKIIELSNQINPFNGVTYEDIVSYSFNQYCEGDFLDWHSDNHEVLNGATITYIVQLNDDYTDGYVKYMLNEDEHFVEKKQGSVFIFDSNIQHSVDKVTFGERFSLNVWPRKKIKKSLI